MNTRLKRPPSVWLTQTLLIIVVLLFISVLLLNLAARLTRGESLPVVGALILCSVVLGIMLFLLITFWGLAARKNYGRWLGVVFLLFVWGLVLMGQLFRTSGPYRYYEYKNTGELVGAAIAAVCINALFIILILRLAFARKVRAFFGTQPE
jgi:hypothetical protein